MAAQDISSRISRWRGLSGATVLLWLIPAAAYYTLLISLSGGLFAPVLHGLTFNSMLLHMLQGRFDVDPATIGDEGYLQGGLVFAYFGVFPALFRALFLWLPGFAQTDFTRIACVAAVSLMALFKLLTVRMLWREAGTRSAPILFSAMIAVTLVAGPQIQFLRPAIYQEVVLWAGAFAAGFLYLLLWGLHRHEGFTPKLLSGMALLAGLTLLTRVSTALGLYAVFGGIWLWVAWQSRGRAANLWPLARPAFIAGLFVGLTALVNVERWGNPLIFMPLTQALMLSRFPDRLARVQTYGDFNFVRLGYGLIYYFLPVWVLRDASGQLWWDDFARRLFDNVELPPSSFFVSDPLIMGLAAFGAVVVWCHRDKAKRTLMILCSLGLAIPGALMLIALTVAFRYRIEFYPFFEFLAFIGFGALAARPTGRAPDLVMGGALVSTVTAHAMWVLYMLSPLGTADQALGSSGIVDFYGSFFR
jgi:hypothetical protein